MRRSLKAWLTFSGLFAVALPLTACGGDDEGGSSVDCTSGVPAFAEVSAFSVCTNCHSSDKSGADRKNAPTEVNFDVYESAAEHAHHAAEAVEAGHMPPRGSGFSINDAQRDQLIHWASCGSPE